MLHEADERASSAGNEPTPQITLVFMCLVLANHVTLNFARSGGPGGQNVNKVNTKLDMRFNVKNAYWLSERIREKIIQGVFFPTLLSLLQYYDHEFNFLSCSIEQVVLEIVVFKLFNVWS
ncbi:hypothetical protein N665_2189s0001 [Sinapis alba]|nr:hypothetical protein N665_2189s0001 [Sinapis alba]